MTSASSVRENMTKSKSLQDQITGIILLQYIYINKQKKKYIYDPGSAVPPPLPPPMVPPHPPLWCGVVVGCFPPPPVVWCGVVVGCFPPPCGVVWFGCGLWWFPPFTPCGVVWVGWFPLHVWICLGCLANPCFSTVGARSL